MRRLRLLIVAGLVLALPSLSCRRRAAGTCADHVDCDPGFDCAEHRCVRRAAVGASPPADAATAVAVPEPVFPTHADDDSPAPPPAPPPSAKTPPAPPRRPAAPPAQPPSVDSPPPPAAGERLPAWQQRRKTF